MLLRYDLSLQVGVLIFLYPVRRCTCRVERKVWNVTPDVCSSIDSMLSPLVAYRVDEASHMLRVVNKGEKIYSCDRLLIIYDCAAPWRVGSFRPRKAADGVLRKRTGMTGRVACCEPLICENGPNASWRTRS
ncbi:hypothetical protein BKA58DRAFT_151220 [Alternaria rosae]|uniref:uncharacterized protein n=1 Tax=Alternaria rosae TaxID=1187941 RepID=UPI001E8E7B13|nr:uncharacterized protein BKA58DRAFT_151220 [Alternaria rosae]KAH6872722.1 hypothetical protein BKA58DRAFT_151220 [Alternaria rosae]